MIIKVIPTIRKIYKDQYELSVDQRLLKFLKKNFRNCKIEILNDNYKNENYDILIISGGNDLPKLVNTKGNRIRNILDNKYFYLAKKKKKKILGICHGSQFIADKFKGKIIKKKKLKENFIYTPNNQIFKTNLYHNYSISFLPKSFIKLAFTNDRMIESFKIKDKLIYGIMWHPERNKRLNIVDKKIIKDLCN